MTNENIIWNMEYGIWKAPNISKPEKDTKDEDTIIIMHFDGFLSGPYCV